MFRFEEVRGDARAGVDDEPIGVFVLGCCPCSIGNSVQSECVHGMVSGRERNLFSVFEVHHGIRLVGLEGLHPQRSIARQ